MPWRQLEYFENLKNSETNEFAAAALSILTNKLRYKFGGLLQVGGLDDVPP